MPTCLRVRFLKGTLKSILRRKALRHGSCSSHVWSERDSRSERSSKDECRLRSRISWLSLEEDSLQMLFHQRQSSLKRWAGRIFLRCSGALRRAGQKRLSSLGVWRTLPSSQYTRMILLTLWYLMPVIWTVSLSVRPSVVQHHITSLRCSSVTRTQARLPGPASEISTIMLT